MRYKLNWGTTMPRNMRATMSVSCALPQTRPGSWKSALWSCIRHTGEWIFVVSHWLLMHFIWRIWEYSPYLYGEYHTCQYEGMGSQLSLKVREQKLLHSLSLCPFPCERHTSLLQHLSGQIISFSDISLSSSKGAWHLVRRKFTSWRMPRNSLCMELTCIMLRYSEPEVWESTTAFGLGVFCKKLISYPVEAYLCSYIVFLSFSAVFFLWNASKNKTHRVTVGLKSYHIFSWGYFSHLFQPND